MSQVQEEEEEDETTSESVAAVDIEQENQQEQQPQQQQPQHLTQQQQQQQDSQSNSTAVLSRMSSVETTEYPRRYSFLFFAFILSVTFFNFLKKGNPVRPSDGPRPSPHHEQAQQLLLRPPRPPAPPAKRGPFAARANLPAPSSSGALRRTSPEPPGDLLSPVRGRTGGAAGNGLGGRGEVGSVLKNSETFELFQIEYLSKCIFFSLEDIIEELAYGNISSIMHIKLPNLPPAARVSRRKTATKIHHPDL